MGKFHIYYDNIGLEIIIHEKVLYENWTNKVNKGVLV